MTRSSTALTSPVEAKLHSLRGDLSRLEPEGLIGSVLFWWLKPVQCVADPVLSIIEKNVIPPVTAHIPGAPQALRLSLKLIEAVSHTAYALTHGIGLVSSSLDHSTSFDAQSVYLTLSAEQDKDENSLSSAELQRILLVANSLPGKYWLLNGLKDTYLSTLTKKQHSEELMSGLWESFGAMYNRIWETEEEDMSGMDGLLLAENKALLAKIQQTTLDGWHRVDELLVENQPAALYHVLEQFSLSEGRYFFMFALAAYGDAAIQRTNKQQGESFFDWTKGSMTLPTIASFTGIPEEDIILPQQGDLESNPSILPHLIAIDRQRKKIILAIRGNARELGKTFRGTSRPFLGGEAHFTIAEIAECLWMSNGKDIENLLNANRGFELIITGHSLGAGVSTLLNLLLHDDARMKGRKFRTFAYGSPPVFCPPASSRSTYYFFDKKFQTCVNYINQYDYVPFLCEDSVLHQKAMMTAVDREMTSPLERAKCLLGLEPPKASLVKEIHDLQREPLARLSPENSRAMSIPVCGSIWLWPSSESKDPLTANFKPFLADSLKMSAVGLFVHQDELRDHSPAMYELILNNASEK